MSRGVKGGGDREENQGWVEESRGEQDEHGRAVLIGGMQG